jgi:hypothetical protein|tara:strand:+ start:1344 stop:2171 length:828 start_codon:yes stop_codon:yes gene_type:complete
MLSIEEIKLTISALKKLRDTKNWEDCIDSYLKKLEELARRVDAYNDDQIQQLDKTKDWYQQELDWTHNRKKHLYDELLDKMIESKIFQFAKAGKTANMQNSLEIGPGYGRYSKMFLSWRLNYFLDLLPTCETKIKKKFHPPHHKYIKFYTTLRCDCSPIPTNSCNFVFSWNTFTFFTQKHINEYLGDMKRVMLPGGYALIHYANCEYDKDLHEAKRGYWNFNTKTDMHKMIQSHGYDIIESDQFKQGANYVIFKKLGNLNPVLYQVLEMPLDKEK